MAQMGVVAGEADFSQRREGREAYAKVFMERLAFLERCLDREGTTEECEVLRKTLFG